MVDVIPEVVTRSLGAEDATTGQWDYTRDGPQVGGNVRWGITNNLTFNGTVNPDFAQVEADVAAIQYDPRAAVSYPERRPFFLEGIENFSIAEQSGIHAPHRETGRRGEADGEDRRDEHRVPVGAGRSHDVTRLGESGHAG